MFSGHHILLCQAFLAHGVHNDRLQLTKPNRDARPGAAIDRLRS